MLVDMVFAMGHMPASWTHLEAFQQVINRQIEESKCVSEIGTADMQICSWHLTLITNTHTSDVQ